MFRDQIICGVKDLNLQRQLLAKPNLTLQMALDKARATENSIRSTAALQKSTNPTVLRQNATVHQDSTERKGSTDEENEVCRLRSVRRRTSEGTMMGCKGCGRNHMRSACHFKDAICWKCDKKGHLARVCRAKQTADYSTTHFRENQPTYLISPHQPTGYQRRSM